MFFVSVLRIRCTQVHLSLYEYLENMGKYACWRYNTCIVKSKLWTHTHIYYSKATKYDPVWLHLPQSQNKLSPTTRQVKCAYTFSFYCVSIPLFRLDTVHSAMENIQVVIKCGRTNIAFYTYKYRICIKVIQYHFNLYFRIFAVFHAANEWKRFQFVFTCRCVDGYIFVNSFYCPFF